MSRLRVGTALALAASLAIGVPSAAHAHGTIARGGPPDVEAAAATEAPEAEPDPEPSSVERDPDTIRREKRIEEAERHFVEGRTLYNQGQYLEAAAEFERSFAAIERAETLYNVVLSYELASRPIDTIRAARRYLALPDCGVGRTGMCAKHRARVERTQRAMRPQVGEIRLDIERGAKLRAIRIEGRPVSLASFPVLLMPGTYEVEFYGTKADQQRTRVVEVEAGQVHHLPVTPFFEPSADVVEPPVEPEPPDLDAIEAERARLERRNRALRASFWTGLGLTVAAGAATTTFGLLGLRAERLHREEMCDPLPGMPGTCDPDDPDHTPPLPGETPSHVLRRGEVDRYRTLTNAMIGVTAVAGVTTVVLGVFAFTRPASRRGSQRFGLSPTGLVVRW